MVSVVAGELGTLPVNFSVALSRRAAPGCSGTVVETTVVLDDPAEVVQTVAMVPGEPWQAPVVSFHDYSGSAQYPECGLGGTGPRPPARTRVISG